METNEDCPAEQEWHKLLIDRERRGGRRAEKERKGQPVERVTNSPMRAA